jgi:hypothetical protein
MRLISDSAHPADLEACPDCGLTYVHDSPSDRRLHADTHDEIVNGASAPLVDVQRIVRKYAEFEILLAGRVFRERRKSYWNAPPPTRIARHITILACSTPGISRRVERE